MTTESITEIVENVRKLVRPIITFTLVFIICYLSLKQIEVPDYIRELVSMVVGFWFGERSALKKPGE